MPAVATKGAPKKPSRGATPAKSTGSAKAATAGARAAKPTPAKIDKGTKPPRPASLAKLPLVAVKPKRPTAPSQPLPPPPPPPPPQRDEMAATRDIARLLRYGEPFGPHKIDVRMLQLVLPVTSGALAVADPAAPKTFRVFDRPVGAGQFRVMLSVARTGDKERLAAVVIHVGRPPIARWTVAHYRGQKKPKSPDQLPRIPIESGWLLLLDGGAGAPGNVAVGAANGVNPIEVPLTDGRRGLAFPCGGGELAAYWAVDAADKPVCLVVDLEVFTQKDWKAKPA